MVAENEEIRTYRKWKSLPSRSRLWLGAEAMRGAMLHASRVVQLQARTSGCPITAYVYACDSVRYMRSYLQLLEEWRKEG